MKEEKPLMPRPSEASPAAKDALQPVLGIGVAVLSLPDFSRLKSRTGGRG